MKTILHEFAERVGHSPHQTAMTLHDGSDYTWASWHHDVRAFAASLVAARVQSGSVLAILSGNRLQWPVADIGGLMAGCLTVGIYPTSPANQVYEILRDCSARIVVVDTAEQHDKVLAVKPALPDLEHIIAASDDSWNRWLRAGRPAGTDEEVDARIAAIQPDDVAILIYTSGSTGIPKGARISHRYITASVQSIEDALGLQPGDSALSFLPFCHAAERVFGLYTRIHVGMSARLVEDGDVWRAAREYQPTIFGGVPRFYEKIYQAIRSSGGAGREVIRTMIGSRVRLATSGGATLSPHVAKTLAEHGLVVLGAYGMTEHLCAAMHRPTSYNFTSVGLPMKGTELRIAANGEIQFRRSALTFSGYHANSGASRAAFTEDGEWLKSGDLGYVDEQGYLHVTGREKELIALSGGKKVAPAPIERKLMENSLISQAVLFGESRRYISALLAVRPQFIDHPELSDRIQQVVDDVNSQLSRPERIRRFALLREELTVERDELTPTLKLKRGVIEERYRAQIEELYQ